jgi:hypothetical protein
LITSRPDRLGQDATLKLKDLLARCPELDAVAACVRSFAQLMAERRGHDLPAWLEQVETTGLQPLFSLAVACARTSAPSSPASAWNGTPAGWRAT